MGKSDMKKRTITFLLLLVTSLGLIAAYSTGLFSGGEDHGKADWRLATVGRMDIGSSVLATGIIKPMVGAEVRVGSRVSGIVKNLHVDIGDAVQKGTLLAELDPTEFETRYSQAEADLKAAEANLEYASLDLTRQRRLLEQELVSPDVRDVAERSFNVAESRLGQAKANLEYARIQLEYTKIHAPISGVVASVSTREGETVAASFTAPTFVIIIDLKRLEVWAYVDETDIGKLRPAMRVRVIPAAYSERELEGEVLKIEPQSIVEQNVTMFPVLVRVDNSEGLLKPGMNCDVEVRVDERRDVLAIPYAALRKEKDVASAALLLGLDPEQVQRGLEESGDFSDVVFVDEEAGPRAVAVEVGLTDFDYVELRSGLSQGESVLLLPTAGLVLSQERFRERVQRVRGDGLPGVRRAGR